MTDYRTLNTPLESYELTKRDHRDQKTSDEISEHVRQKAEEWRAEEAADPELRRLRRERAMAALTILHRSRTPDYQLMRWRVRLYCGHITETTRHSENSAPTMHGLSSICCPQCGRDPSHIVAYEPIGLLAEQPPVAQRPPAQIKRPTRAQLEDRIGELESELVALRQQHGEDE